MRLRAAQLVSLLVLLGSLTAADTALRPAEHITRAEAVLRLALTQAVAHRTETAVPPAQLAEATAPAPPRTTPTICWAHTLPAAHTAHTHAVTATRA